MEQDPIDLNELKAFAAQAVQLAIPHIEETGTFLPFGGVLTTGNEFQMVVYHDGSENVDHRAHASIIQKLIAEKYQDPKCLLIFMAWDGIAHLETGDIDCINVRVGNKFLNHHKIFIFTYRKVNGKVELTDPENPMMRDV